MAPPDTTSAEEDGIIALSPTYNIKIGASNLYPEPESSRWLGDVQDQSQQLDDSYYHSDEHRDDGQDDRVVEYCDLVFSEGCRGVKGHHQRSVDSV